ncbi:MAG: hypothetical protein KC543_05960 [Myxococcales bacterium]|nr:hypothetical protein [Myxococcales bacterium]
MPRPNVMRRTKLPLAVTVLASAVAIGCASSRPYMVVGTARAESVSGVARVDADARPPRVDLELDHLPSPEHIAPGHAAYVVWLLGPAAAAAHGGQPSVLARGTLQYDEASREGRLSMVAPVRSFELRVTAERDASVSGPSDLVVASQQIGVN